MKIGIDISQAVFGTGVSDYTIDLVHALTAVDPTNNYVYFGASLRRLGELKQLFPEARLFHLPPMFMHFLWNRLHILGIENFLGDTDVFHSSDWVQPPTDAAAVTTVHDLSPFLYPEEMKSGSFRNIREVHTARMRWVIRDCKKIICVSESTASQLQSLFKVRSDTIAVIPEALPTRHSFRPAGEEINIVKARYGLKNYLVAIATPQPRKNISGLVRSYLQFKDKLRFPEKLVIIGGHGWGMTDIPSDPDVIFTGFLPNRELVALLAGAEAFVYPSLNEGFGLPILEAFFQRVPVVTSEISSMPEVAGNAAVLVNPKDIESIAEGINKAIKNKKTLVALGTKRLSGFTWEKTAQKTLMVYSQIC